MAFRASEAVLNTFACKDMVRAQSRSAIASVSKSVSGEPVNV